MGFCPFILWKIVVEECIALIMTIFFVERALVKKFDKDGNEML